MRFRETTEADVPDLFAVRVATHENRLTQEELSSIGITEDSVKERLKVYTFYRRHGWIDDRIEDGLRYMTKDLASGQPA